MPSKIDIWRPFDGPERGPQIPKVHEVTWVQLNGRDLTVGRSDQNPALNHIRFLVSLKYVSLHGIFHSASGWKSGIYIVVKPDFSEWAACKGDHLLNWKIRKHSTYRLRLGEWDKQQLERSLQATLV